MGLGSLGSPPNRGSDMCEGLRQEGAEGHPKTEDLEEERECVSGVGEGARTGL